MSRDDVGHDEPQPASQRAWAYTRSQLLSLYTAAPPHSGVLLNVYSRWASRPSVDYGGGVSAVTEAVVLAVHTDLCHCCVALTTARPSSLETVH